MNGFPEQPQPAPWRPPAVRPDRCCTMCARPPAWRLDRAGDDKPSWACHFHLSMVADELLLGPELHLEIRKPAARPATAVEGKAEQDG